MSLLLFPFPKVVFFVRQNMADVTPLAVVMDNHDEAVLVPSNVEHHELANLISTAKHLPHIREILPASVSNHLDPMPYSRLCIRIFFPELFQRPTGYETHCLHFRKLRNSRSNKKLSQYAKPFGLQRLLTF